MNDIEKGFIDILAMLKGLHSEDWANRHAMKNGIDLYSVVKHLDKRLRILERNRVKDD